MDKAKAELENKMLRKDLIARLCGLVGLLEHKVFCWRVNKINKAINN
jgi:hypothetical protein